MSRRHGPGAAHRVGILGLLLVAAVLCASAPATAQIPRDRVITLSRGVNLISVFTPRPMPALEQDLDEIAAAGLHHVRIFVDPDWVLRQQGAGPTRLQQVVTAALVRRLGVILCMASRDHPLEGSVSPETVSLWVNAWHRLAERFARRSPSMIFFELANEPGIPPAEWNQLQAKLLATVRQAAPGNTILLTGSPTSTAWSLADLAPVADSDVAYTFHLYQPMAFTHQGADWDARFQPLRGIHYPPDAERTGGQAGLPAAAAQELANYRRHGATLMGDDVAAAARWAGDHHAHLVVTEFGVYRTADLRSRAAWMSEARRRLEQSGIGWTVWEYDGGFGIKPDLEHCTTVAAALGLRCIREAPAG